MDISSSFFGYALGGGFVPHIALTQQCFDNGNLHFNGIHLLFSCGSTYRAKKYSLLRSALCTSRATHPSGQISEPEERITGYGYPTYWRSSIQLGSVYVPCLEIRRIPRWMPQKMAQQKLQYAAFLHPMLTRRHLGIKCAASTARRHREKLPYRPSPASPTARQATPDDKPCPLVSRRSSAPPQWWLRLGYRSPAYSIGSLQ